LKKDFLTILNLTKDDINALLNRAFELKDRYKKGIIDKTLDGKILGLIFEKPSTRTRVSFESAIIQLGGSSVFLKTSDTQIDREEPIKDTARVLSRYLDCLAIRTFSQEILNEFAVNSSIPIINALTDLFHPCQVLSDLMTVIESKGGYDNLKFVWVGDGNNVAHSWINAALVLDINITLACPEGYMPNHKVLEFSAENNNKNKIKVTQDPFEAVKDADVVYTDVWASMGKESEKNLRKSVFTNFQVNKNFLKLASKDVIVMHCLPAHRGEEITDEIIEGKHSVVWDQSENKMHLQKALLEFLIINRS
jgi:ornithine carbamoyltransferase